MHLFVVSQGAIGLPIVNGDNRAGAVLHDPLKVGLVKPIVVIVGGGPKHLLELGRGGSDGVTKKTGHVGCLVRLLHMCESVTEKQPLSRGLEPIPLADKGLDELDFLLDALRGVFRANFAKLLRPLLQDSIGVVERGSSPEKVRVGAVEHGLSRVIHM